MGGDLPATPGKVPSGPGGGSPGSVGSKASAARLPGREAQLHHSRAGERNLLVPFFPRRRQVETCPEGSISQSR